MMIFGRLIPTALVQWAASLAVAVAVFFTWLATHDAKVVSKERASVQAKGEKTRAKAQTARNSVPAVGAFDRLRKSACRDC